MDACPIDALYNDPGKINLDYTGTWVVKFCVMWHNILTQFIVTLDWKEKAGVPCFKKNPPALLSLCPSEN